MRIFGLALIMAAFIAGCAAPQRPITIKGSAIVPEVAELDAMARGMRLKEKVREAQKQEQKPDAPSTDDAINGYLQKALGHMEANPAASLLIYEKILSIDPARWDAHYNAGIIYLKHKDFERAEQQFYSALKNNGPKDKVYGAIGAVQMLKGRDSSAADNLKLALEHEKGKTTLLNLAGIYQRLNNRQEAFKYFKMLEGLSPAEPEVNYSMGVFLYKYAEFPEALKYFNAAYEADKKNPLILTGKAQTLLRLYNYEAALSAYKEASILDPNDATVYKNMGIIYELYLEDLDNAIANYLLAFAKGGPGSDELKAWIDVVSSRIEAKGRLK